MIFKNINGTLIAGCQQAHEFLQVCLDEVELFSLDGIRTMAQNKKMWPMLSDITAAWKAQVFVQGIGGTLVVIPARTSRLNKKEFSELIEAIYSFGSGEDVRWSEPALAAYELYREAA